MVEVESTSREGMAELPFARMSRNKDGLDLLANVVQTGAEVAGVPGVSLGIALLQRAAERRTAARVHEFFTRLAVATGCGDAAAAAEEVAKHIEDENVQEAIDRGFRMMMGAVDDAVKPCIAVLVAEYYLEKRSPDRAFQRVGALLMDSVRRDLSLLRAFCECVAQLGKTGSSADRLFVRDEKTSDIFLIAARDMEQQSFRSSAFVGIDRGMAAVSLLTRHGFGDLWTGMSYTGFGGTPLLKFGARSDGAYLLLGRCLSVLEAERMGGSGRAPQGPG